MAYHEDFVRNLKINPDTSSFRNTEQEVEKLKEKVASPVKMPVEVDLENSKVDVDTGAASEKIKSLTDAIENFKKSFNFKELKTGGDPFSEVYDRIVADNQEVVASMGNLKAKVEEVFNSFGKADQKNIFGGTEILKDQIRLQLQLTAVQEEAARKASEIYSSKSYMEDPEKLKELLRLLQQISAINARNTSADESMVAMMNNEELGTISHVIDKITDSAENAKVKISDIIKSLSSEQGKTDILAGWQNALTALQSASDQTSDKVVADQKEQTQAIQETVKAQQGLNTTTANITVDTEAIKAKVQEALNAVDQLVKERQFPIQLVVDDSKVKEQIEVISKKSIQIPVGFDAAGVQSKVNEIITKLNSGFNSEGFAAAIQSMEPALAGMTGKMHIAVETWKAELGLFNSAIVGTQNRLNDLKMNGGAGGTATVNVDAALQNIEQLKQKIEELKNLLSSFSIQMVLNDKSYTDVLNKLKKLREDANNIPVKFKIDSELQKNLQSQIKKIESTVKKIKVQFYAPIADTRKELNAVLAVVESRGLHKVKVNFQIAKADAIEKINQAIDNSGQKFKSYTDSVKSRSEEQINSLNKVLATLREVNKELHDISATAQSIKGLDVTKSVRQRTKTTDEVNNPEQFKKNQEKYLAGLAEFKRKESELFSRSTGYQNFMSGANSYYNTDELNRQLETIQNFVKGSEKAFGDGKTAQREYMNEFKRLLQIFDQAEKQGRKTGRELERVVNPQSKDVVNDVVSAYERLTGTQARTIKTQDQANGEYKRVTVTMKEAEGEIKQYTARINSATGAVEEMGTSTTRAMNFVEKFTNSFRNKGVELATWLTTFASFHRITAQLRDAINIVREIDSSMTELRKVSNDSESAIRGFGDAAFDIGQTVGATGKEVIDLAADYSRLGYSINEASELAKNSAIYMNVSELNSTSEATEHLVSVMKAYNLTAQDSVKIIDELNEVGKTLPMNGYIGQRVGTPETEQRLSRVLRMRNDCGQRVVTSVVKPIHVRISYHM